jgi:hypothetical protein
VCTPNYQTQPCWLRLLAKDPGESVSTILIAAGASTDWAAGLIIHFSPSKPLNHLQRNIDTRRQVAKSSKINLQVGPTLKLNVNLPMNTKTTLTASLHISVSTLPHWAAAHRPSHFLLTSAPASKRLPGQR